MTSTEGIGRRPLVKLAVAVRLLIGVSTGVGDAVAETRFGNVGLTELLKPKFELMAVAGTTTSTNLDVRKQT